MNLLKSTHVFSFIFVSLSLCLLYLRVFVESLEYFSLSSQQSQVVILLSLQIQFLLCLRVDVQQLQCILDEVVLNESIEWSVSRKARCMIDFEQYWPQIVGEHDIEPKYVKTHIPRILFGLAVSILVLD